MHAALLFLQGKTDEVLAQLKRQMDAAAAALEFERAARTRDKIARLQQLQSRQFVESATAADIDVVVAVHEENVFAVNAVMIRGGRHVGDRTFFPRHAESGGETDVVTAFLTQHYVERPVPRTIIAPQANEAEALAERVERAVGAQGRDRDQPRRRAARVGHDGDAKRDARDPAEARAEGDAGGPARGAAGSAAAAVVGAADRMLRRLATRWARRRSPRA